MGVWLILESATKGEGERMPASPVKRPSYLQMPPRLPVLMDDFSIVPTLAATSSPNNPSLGR